MTSHSRRSFILLGAVALLASLSHASDRPNIVLLMGDDHGWEETGYNGHPHLHTPVLDEMAASGLRLDHFYAAHPTCSPTRGSVLTGRHPNRYGTFTPNYSIRPGEVTVAHLLAEAGYATAHFGKWHVGPVKASSPTNPGAMGFDEWLSHDNFFELDPPLSRNGAPPEVIEGESSEILVDEAIDFIDGARESEQPFFTVIWFGSPHQPYAGLPEDLARYDDLPGKYGETEMRVTSFETGTWTERPFDEVLQERFAEITAMDRAIGTLRDHLEKAGVRGDTLLWYCGDNGTPRSGQMASPFRGRKGNMYEGGIRVPAVIEWPERISEPRASDLNTVTSDMLPTICSIAGLEAPDRPLDGVDLAPLIDGEMTERPEPIYFWQFDARREAGRDLEPFIDPELQEGTTPLVKLAGDIPTRNFRNFHHPRIMEGDYEGPRVALDGRHKLVVHDRGEGKPPRKELFDLRADRAEENDLSDDRPKVVERLEERLREWQTSVLESLVKPSAAKAER